MILRPTRGGNPGRPACDATTARDLSREYSIDDPKHRRVGADAQGKRPNECEGVPHGSANAADHGVNILSRGFNAHVCTTPRSH
jgi:hypothetical protein